MSRAVVSLISRMGYGESRAGYEERMGAKPLRFNPATPIPEARIRRRRERLRLTTEDIRAGIRREIVLTLGMIADPENDWRIDDLQIDLGKRLNRYRFAISAMRCEPRPALPADEHADDATIDDAAERALFAVAAE